MIETCPKCGWSLQSHTQTTPYWSCPTGRTTVWIPVPGAEPRCSHKHSLTGGPCVLPVGHSGWHSCTVGADEP